MKVLSILSFVSHGYVGNRAIVYPLQCQGWDVDFLNTVNFSNHTGYGTFKGGIIDDDVLQLLLENLPGLDYLITGYLPNERVIKSIVEYLVEHRPKVYLLDPIMGDENHLYVDKSCVLQYQQLLDLGLVDIITPNQFELELLTNKTIKGPKEIGETIDFLKSKSIKFIVITSCEFSDPNVIYCFVASLHDERIKYFKIPMIECYFTGVGDLFTALLLDKLYKNHFDNKANYDLDDLSKSVNQVLSIMHKVLVKTQKGRTGSVINDLSIKEFELELIDSKDFFDLDDCMYEEFDLLEESTF